jgi:glycosyltransferase involved in cell wall biosynthesis
VSNKLEPLVSVIMPVYNGEQFLVESINSILSQSLKNFEFIIINDGSTDGTLNITESFSDPRIKLINRNKKGLISSLNKGIDIASGKYITRHDCDDISLMNRLQTQVQFLDSNPEFVIIGSSSILIDAKGKILKFIKSPVSNNQIRWESFLYNPFQHPAVTMRRSLFIDNKLRYNPSDLHAEDKGLWFKVLREGKGGNLLQPLVKRRKHQRQVSNIHSKIQQSNSDRLTKNNFSSHGLDVSDDEIQKLRKWYFKYPKLWSEADARLLMKYLEFICSIEYLSKFNENMDYIRRYADRLLNPFYLAQKNLWKSGIYKSIIQKDIIGIIFLPIRVINRVFSKLKNFYYEVVIRIFYN